MRRASAYHPVSGAALRFDCPPPEDLRGGSSSVCAGSAVSPQTFKLPVVPYTKDERFGAEAPDKEGCVSYTKLPAPSPEQGLSRYVREIRGFRCSSPSREYMLAKAGGRSRRQGGASLVTRICGWRPKIAMGYRGYGLPIAEVISEPMWG